MAEPRFLSVEDVLEIHADQIERYGGSAGVREVEPLQSAVSMPEAGFGEQDLHANLYAMAAAYLSITLFKIIPSSMVTSEPVRWLRLSF